jgi:hypothetical protein
MQLDITAFGMGIYNYNYPDNYYTLTPMDIEINAEIHNLFSTIMYVIFYLTQFKFIIMVVAMFDMIT